MITRTVIKDHLALDRRTFSILATGSTAIAGAGTTLYNLGCFAPIEWRLISRLTAENC